MGNANMVYEWEGDSTQALTSYTYKIKRFLIPKRVRFAFARILFELGDFEAYWALVQVRNDVIARNLAKIAEGSIDGAGGRIGGGFWFAEAPISSTSLETVPDLPVYAGDKTLVLKTYAGGVLQSTKEIYSDRPFRLGVDVRSLDWEFEIIGNADKIHQLDIATSVREIAQEFQEG